MIGLGTAAVTFRWKQDWHIAATIGLAMILNFLTVASTGVLIPLDLKKMDVDTSSCLKWIQNP